ncbi:MAG: 1-acyl-sn-glycerol-3-phosphate acyltransferase [Actinomycetota bacterium]
MTDRHSIRRALSISAVLVGLPLWLVTLPLWVVGATIADLIGGLRRLPTVRLIAFLGVYLVHDWIGIAVGGWLWLTGRFGRRLDLDRHRRVQGWWGTSLLNWAGRLLNVRLDLDDLGRLPSNTFVMLSRHASMIDAVVPVTLVATRMGRFIHYVLKKELRWDPSLDLFGGRLGNHFVTRGGDTEAEEAAIERLAADAEPDAALVIFPEGTYSTPGTRKRVHASLERNEEFEALARAKALETLLPPKPAGTLAMLRGQPEADVVVVGHVGLEGVAELKGLRQRLPLTHPVIVRWWVHRRAELPTTEAELIDWLGDRWEELDRWVEAIQAERRVSPSV